MSWSDTQIIARVNTGAGPGCVEVIQTGIGNCIPFAMTPPTITSLNPSSGAPGTQVTVTGAGFGAAQGGGWVRLGSLSGTVVSWSDSQIVATIVPGSAGANVVVTQNYASSNSVPFYITPAVITNVTPTSGAPGTQVTITGSGFCAQQGGGTVRLGSINGTVVSWSDAQVVATVAAGSAAGWAQIYQNSVNSNGVPFSMIAATVASVTQSSGSGGTQVTITGSGFGTSQGSGYVRLGTLNANIGSWSDTQIAATVAAGSAAGFAYVFQNGISSNALPFTSTPPPANVLSATPSIGSPGTQVTVAGTGFGGAQGTSRVQLGSTWANVVTWSDTQIVATVASGAGTGVVTVKVGAAYSNQIPFAMAPATITSVTPAPLSIGGQVTITGTGFGGAQGTGQVFMGSGGTHPTITSWSDTQIVGSVVAGTLPGSVWMQQNGVTSNAVPITMAPATITSVTPTTLSIGGQVTVTGTGFGGVKGSGQIFIGSQATQPTITSWSDTQIVATVVAGTQPGSLWIRQNGVTSNGIPIIIPAPNITGLNPVNGPVGTQVTITGTGFGATQGGGSVSYLGNKPGIVVSWSDTQIVATVANGAGPGAVIVLQNGLNSNTLQFDVATFSISGVSPAYGLPGTQVTVSGSGFGATQGSGKIWIGTAYANVVTWSDTQIVATSAARSQTGTVQVFQNNYWSNAVNFTVNPNITGLSPTSGAVFASVTINGTNFGTTQGSSTVTFNGTPASPTNWSPTSIIVPVPTSATTGNVVVAVNGVDSNGVSFTVLPTPNITGLSPTSGSVGIPVNITGTNFGSTGSVMFNSTSATPTSWSATSIAVPVPPGATTGNVVVTVGGVYSNGIAFTILSGSFVATSGQMAASRYGQTATQLTTGRVLIVGGKSTSGVMSSAELYSPSSQTFAAASAMNIARWLHTSTLLNDGTVLIVGGSELANQETLDSAEIYNPSAGTFTLLSSSLNTARVGHTATLLNNGQVLIVGGYDPQFGLIADAELYDPPTQTFIDLGDTNAPRYGHTATMLQNGQVLIAGGETDAIPTAAYDTAEVFDPISQTFTPVPVPMTAMREGHAAVVLNNGQVLITGGDIPGTGSLNTAEIYDPISQTFTPVPLPMTVPRISHVMTVLNGGKVLIACGATDSGGNTTPLNTAELYDPASQTFAAVAGNMTSVREHETASLLNDGTVLETGGTDGSNIFNTAELYMPSRLNGLTSIAITPATSSIGAGAQQRFTAVGTFSDSSTQTLSSVLWSSSSAASAPISGDATNPGVAATAAQGTTTITASAVGVSGLATLTITPPTLVSITLSPQDAAIPLGATQQFTATGVYTDGSTQDLTATATWSSSATVVAAINGSGLAAGLFQGTATIRVNSGSLSASTTLSVGAPALVSITVTPATVTIAAGSSQQYQAIGTYSDGSTQNVTTLLTWSSGTPAIATVANTGFATGLTQGTATLTGGFESVSASVTLTVGPPTLVSLTIVPNAASLSTGATQQLSATGTYTNGSTQDFTASSTWVSSNTNVIAVSGTGLATAVAAGDATITAMSGSMNGTAALVVTTGTTQANLNTSRYQHSATILDNGQILVAGGINCPTSGSCTYLNSAELYNPGTSAFTNTGAMATARSAPAVQLNSGKVLIAGGYTCNGSGNCSSLNNAEIYDPTTSTFSGAGSMTVARNGHTMTLLGNGTVLISGGENCTSTTSCTAMSSAEIYDPIAGTFTVTNSMTAARFGASAVLLSSGSVLIAGGFDGTNLPAAAEIYNPANRQFTGAGPSLNLPRFDASATLLNNGQVLVAGGSTRGLPACPTNAAEIYDPVSNTFSIVAGGMVVARFNHTATLLTNGGVVVAGGFSSCGSPCTSEATTEFFDPVAVTFTSGQPVSTPLAGHTGTLLANGNVLLIGGINEGVTLGTDEWYQPNSLTPTGLVSVAVTPASSFLMPGQTQQFVATGTFNNGSTQTLQSVVWNSSNPPAAAISNSPGSAGMVNAQAIGATTLTATAGDIGGTASLNVAGLVSLAITPTNPSIPLSSSQQLAATGTFSDGSQQNITTTVTWGSSNSLVAAVLQSSFIHGVVVPVAAGTVNITATFGSISASTAVTVVAPPVASPVVSGISPASGVAGTQVTIAGSGFGSAQGSGTVVLGSALGVVVSWSDTQVIATVANGSVSGIALVQQGGVESNSLAFMVNNASIASVSPTSGLPGTQVTITGSGFGGNRGSGQVWLGTANGVVTTVRLKFR